MSFWIVTPELEAWMESHRDPNWKPKRKYLRDRRGRFSK